MSGWLRRFVSHLLRFIGESSRGILVIKPNLLCFNKRPNGADQIWRRLDTESLRTGRTLESIELLMEFLLIHRDENAALRGESLRGRDLMIVAMLAEIGAARHHENLFAEFEGGNDRSHPSMGDDQAGDFNVPSEFVSTDERRGTDVLGTKVGWTSLGKNVCAATHASPFVDGPDQAIEAPLRADGDKNHSTEPT